MGITQEVAEKLAEYMCQACFKSTGRVSKSEYTGPELSQVGGGVYVSPIISMVQCLRAGTAGNALHLRIEPELLLLSLPCDIAWVPGLSLSPSPFLAASSAFSHPLLLALHCPEGCLLLLGRPAMLQPIKTRPARRRRRARQQTTQPKTLSMWCGE